MKNLKELAYFPEPDAPMIARISPGLTEPVIFRSSRFGFLKGCLIAYVKFCHSNVHSFVLSMVESEVAKSVGVLVLDVKKYPTMCVITTMISAKHAKDQAIAAPGSLICSKLKLA